MYNDVELYQRYRFDRQTILDLIDLVRDDLEPRTLRNHALPPELQLFAALRFYACGSFQQVTGDTVHISQPSMSRVITKVTESLLRHLQHVIVFPEHYEVQRLSEEFYEIAQFPGVIGVIDGTHVWIQGPSFHEWRYVNRKNYYSINVQVVFDPRYRFTNVVARWPGSTHDSVLLRESGVAEIMERRQGDHVLLGDSGYPLKPWLMTPFLDPNTAGQRRYNRTHKKTRCLVERAIGQWKRRFNCLHGKLRYTPNKACAIISACAMLQNIAIDRRLPDFEEEEVHHQPQPDEDGDDVENIVQFGRRNGAAARDYIVQQHF
jgi:hypothetical protein